MDAALTSFCASCYRLEADWEVHIRQAASLSPHTHTHTHSAASLSPHTHTHLPTVQPALLPLTATHSRWRQLCYGKRRWFIKAVSCFTRDSTRRDGRMFVWLLLYAIETVLQLYLGGDMMYEMWGRERKPEPTLLLTQGIFKFNLPHHIGMV